MSAEQALSGSSYELIRARLIEQARALGVAASALNDKRKEVFGGAELSVEGSARVRTENNCVPCDIKQVAGHLLFGYNVFIGLKRGTKIEDVFSLRRLELTDGALELAEIPLGSPETAFLDDPRFAEDFLELYRFYKEARLVQFSRDETKLLAIFQIGQTRSDVRVFRWALDADGVPSYVDNRGERDYAFPPAHPFEWTATTREDNVRGRHPHVSILDEVFVETIGGTLTIKVENNTEQGEGIYQEPVDEPNQSLDDADIRYAKLGTLILLKIKPYREERFRYLVHATRAHHAVRIDAIGQACVELPEDHGVVFPGGYFLQDGTCKVFDGDFASFEYERAVRAPNGEDVLYVFHRRDDGHYALLPYNLIRKEVQNPIRCHGYSLFGDGRMVVFRGASDEPTRVHPMQLWQTPFVSADHAALQPRSGGVLDNIGNAELVRGISDAYSIKRAIEETEPSRRVFEDLIAAVTRCLDSYYWLGEAEIGDLASQLVAIRGTAELIVDEFVKVVAIRQRAEQAVAEATEAQQELLRRMRPEGYSSLSPFMEALTALRRKRGELISLRDLRYVDLARLDALEGEIVEFFDQMSKATVAFLLDEEALTPLSSELAELLSDIEKTEKTNELEPLGQRLESTSEGLTVVSEVVGGLEVQDPTARTQILERIGEVFAQVNRVRATYAGRKKELLGREGKAEFAAQFQLLSQSVTSALGLSDTPDACDEKLSRLMLQLEELEARFSEFDEFVGELAQKREEVYEAFEQKKQQLLDDRARRAQTLMGAAERILSGVARRAKSVKDAAELNAFFASDPMVLKLQDVCQRLDGLGDGTRADEVKSKLKASKQDALRGLRDRADLYEEGVSIIKLGRHRFTVNTESLELTLLPHGDGLALSLSGTHFREPIEDAALEQTRDFWDQQLASETDAVYRGEYLAASLLFAGENQESGLSLELLREAARNDTLHALCRQQAAERFDEGYERGLHDADAALILGKLIKLRDAADLLRFSPEARAHACLFWAFVPDGDEAASWRRRALSLGHVRSAFDHTPALSALAGELADAMQAFFVAEGIEALPARLREASHYLVEELTAETPRFVTSGDAIALRERFLARLEREDTRRAFEQDLQALEGQLRAALSLSRAWVTAYLAADLVDRGEAASTGEHLALELAVMLLTEQRLDREPSRAATSATVEGLLGQHPRIDNRRLALRLDEFLSRLGEFALVRVPGFRAYRRLRQSVLERERARLRLSELMPRVLSSFVRNKLINDVYLPILGDNLAKQLGAVGEGKRTDLMGLLLLISPPGYGKTTLMEYLASRLGLVFMKINGPALGHGVHSLDPAEAPNATARQEVEKINLAFEMGNNVMLYLDDIQHTHPELLQKFISLCDAQRRVEGVWKGVTRTYDLRGRRFCVVMAGNPYTESGEKFQVPDMLANRADIYNLGDILGGQEDAFALSYIENAITSNAVLAPLATREPADVYLLMRMAQGEEIPTTDLSHSYAAVELEEIKAVLQRLSRVRDLLLAINQQYIASAAMDDNFRTEPPFKLQGSYRNMNKLAEKVVAAMNDAEIERLLDDHYLGEAQTLTTGAEHNLLKLAELRGVMSQAQEERWSQIKRDFRRVKTMGGADDDPVSRVTGQLGALGSQLELIRDTLAGAAAAADERARETLAHADRQRDGDGLAVRVAEELGTHLDAHLGRLDGVLAALSRPQLEVTVRTEPPPGIDELLGQQVAIVERTLVPLVRVATQHMADSTELSRSIGTILGMTRAIAERIEDIQRSRMLKR